MKDKETFNYTYSAKQQKEIENIRKKYLAPEEDKLEQLRRLDRGVYKKATVCSIAVGIVGALILGSGMSLVMTDLNKVLRLSDFATMVGGICLGIAGIVLVCCAFPIYNKCVERESERVAPEIIRLSDELLN